MKSLYKYDDELENLHHMRVSLKNLLTTLKFVSSRWVSVVICFFSGSMIVMEFQRFYFFANLTRIFISKDYGYWIHLRWVACLAIVMTMSLPFQLLISIITFMVVGSLLN